jgi:L-fuconolactonase
LIDAHQHFWRIGRNGHEWPTPDLARIYQDYCPKDWLIEARRFGVTSSVAVQSQPDEADTLWLLELAQTTPSIRAVVGWTDLKAKDAAEAIFRLGQNPKLKGLRPMLQNLAQDDWILDPALDPAIETMVALGLRFDALVFTRHLPHLRAFAERWPELPIVIDHCAKPPVADGAIDLWRREMAHLAALPNVMCKLSGLLTEMAPGQQREALAPYGRAVCELFGPERLMWGSDWPVLLLAGTYAQWLELAGELCGFDAAGNAQLFGGTAARFYGIEGE